VFVALACACGTSPTPPSDAGTDADASNVPTAPAAHSSAMAITKDGGTIFVVNPDADSISIVDTQARTLKSEVLLAGAHPAPDGSGNYAPAVMPRALVLSADEKTLFVTGERSGKVHVVDVASASATSSVAVCSEPTGIVLSPDGTSLYVACSQDNSVARIDATNASALSVKSSVAVGVEPWALAWSADGATLYATQFLTGGVTAINPNAMTAKAPFVIPDVAPRGDKRLAHGEPRGLYDVVDRPGTSELWVALSMLGTDTAQPDLDFESTTFATLAVMTPDGGVQRTMSIDAQDIAGVNGAFADVVSGAHAVAFTKDGAYALMVDTNSEDILVVDAVHHVESSLLRPLPGHQPESIAFSPDESHAYLQERNTNDVVVLDVTRTATTMTLAVDGAPIATLANDPMPTVMRLGQHLFYSANSDEYPITTNHWVACATCHMEGRSDAVTWRFLQGPRDTPTNAGGVLGTGLLFRTADRQVVGDYWRTVNTEQGGHFGDGTDPTIQTLLAAITEYVNFGIPTPIPPTTDPQLVAQGQTIFQSGTTPCSSCHSGPRFTDSGLNNPTLDLTKPNLHDVGTCVTGGVFPDVAHTDIDNDARAACQFDTPSLTGVWSTPPYFHDGSAATLSDAASRMAAFTNTTLSPEDMNALVEYLKSL
jgi:YVTN family beta-propeller protein